MSHLNSLCKIQIIIHLKDGSDPIEFDFVIPMPFAEEFIKDIRQQIFGFSFRSRATISLGDIETHKHQLIINRKDVSYLVFHTSEIKDETVEK